MAEIKKNLTIGEEIDEWKESYNRANKTGKWAMQQIAAGEYFKAEQVWKFVKEQKPITKEDAFKDVP